MSNEVGTLYVVATPIGNLGDLGRRAAEVLASVDLIAAEDTRRTRALLRHLGLDRPLLALHEHNEQARVDSLVQRLRSGDTIALVSDAGTPLISDPGFPLVRACHGAGIRVVPVPGPSALIAALSVAGLPTDRFRFEGFLPRREAARASLLGDLAAAPETLVFYESSHRILETLAALVAAFGGARPATLARELTKLHETLLTGTLEEIHAAVATDEHQRKGEFVLVVGGAPPREGDRFELSLANTLDVLLQELPLKRAVAVTARLSGENRNRVYRLALERQRAQQKDEGGTD
ncbi:MAG: 16S rRNA (cytidine(1402)-2'-O)-methyltransferase [Gammaproteobacteria bacterium]|nr:MAG: 16S rRNA (cytidine(1402)-2'-O)-methyltransferase [Gammaproteobacteria bacterium]